MLDCQWSQFTEFEPGELTFKTHSSTSNSRNENHGYEFKKDGHFK